MIPIQPSNFTPLDDADPTCGDCADGKGLDFAFS